MKQKFFLLACAVVAFFLTSAAGTSAPQNAKSELEQTPQPYVTMFRITDDYPSKYELVIDHWMMDEQNVEIYYSVKATPEEEDLFVRYNGPIYYDCRDYLYFFMGPLSVNLYITAYAVADGMEPSDITFYYHHFDYIDFCYTLHNPDAFNVDGLYYEKNKNDETMVYVTYRDGGVVVDLDESIPPAMELWNYEYNDIVDLVIPSEINYGGQTYQVTGVGGYTFCDLDQLETVTLPSTMKYIGTNSFLGANHLKSVYFPDLEGWCKIRFGYGSNILGMYKFDGEVDLYINNEKLVNLVVPDNIDTLYCTFQGLKSLRSVVLPSSVKYIDNAFETCVGIKTVTCLGTTPPEFQDIFPDFELDEPNVFVPQSALETYKNHPVWGYMNHIYAIEDRGDVNGSGGINITDVTGLISYLLGTSSDEFNATYADVNGDGNISISDVTALIEILLSSN